MTYRPKLYGKKEKIISISMAIAAIVLFALSGVVSMYNGVYQITSLIFAVAGVHMYLKYIVYDYVYEAADNDIRIYKISGKKSICVLSLSYEMSLSYVIDEKEYREKLDELPKTSFTVSWAKNLSPEKYYVYFFDFNGKKCMLKFEPDKEFADYVNTRIRTALEDNQDIE